MFINFLRHFSLENCVFLATFLLFPPQSEDFSEEKVRFGVEIVYLDGWMRHRIYDAFKEVLESGVSHHLQVRKPTF